MGKTAYTARRKSASKKASGRATRPPDIIGHTVIARGAQPLRSDSLLAIVVILSAGALYLRTAARDIVVGDTGDFMTTAAILGVAHPPGYPLLAILGHAFSLLPIGSLPFRVNLIAVVSDAITVGLVCATARRLGASRFAAGLASLTLAVNPLFWEWSLEIEAFPLNNVLAALLTYLLVRWEAEPERGGFLAGAALCGGLGAANHQTIIFLIPMVVVVAWRRRRSIDTRTALMCAAAIAIGLLPYLYIPWAAAREPFINWGNISSARDLVRHFLRSDYGTGRLVAAGAPSGSAASRLAAFGASFTLLEATFVVLGTAAAYQRTRWFLWGAGSSFALAGPAFVAYANIDTANPPLLWALTRFFLMAHVIAAPLAALGIVALVDIVRSRLASAHHGLVETAVALGAMAGILTTAVAHYRAIDLNRNHVAHAFAVDVLATLPANSVLLALGDEAVFPIAYVQAVEKQRPDVTLVMLGLFRSFRWYVQELRRRDPGLVIPFARYDPSDSAASLRALVAANPGRTFALVGSATDSSLNGSYWLYRRGVIEQIEPMATDIGLAAAAQDNDQLLRSYHLPDREVVRRNTFEIGIVAKYAHAAAAMGDQFALAHLNDEATRWYERALSIDPGATDVRRALAKLRRSAGP